MVYHKRVTNNQHRIECSQCDRWTHALCTSVSDKDYVVLTEETTLSWFCPDFPIFLYELPYPTSSPSNSTLNSELTVSSCSLGYDVHCYISSGYFNALSICNIRYDFQALIQIDAPNFIAITETFLDYDLDDCLFFPSKCTVYCKDRNCHGGG